MISNTGSKSWKMTLLTLIIAVAVPFINGQLPESNQISEEFVWGLMATFGISATAGVVSSVHKRSTSLKEKTNADKQSLAEAKAFQNGKVRGELDADIAHKRNTNQTQHQYPAQQIVDTSRFSIKTPQAKNPHITNDRGWFGTSFQYDEKVGNKVEYGTAFLWVQINGDTSFVQGNIKGPDGNLVQVEHTGTSTNKWDNILRFELYEKSNGNVVPFKRGEYTLFVESDNGTSYLQKTTDKFQIV